MKIRKKVTIESYYSAELQPILKVLGMTWSDYLQLEMQNFGAYLRRENLLGKEDLEYAECIEALNKYQDLKRCGKRD